MPHKELKEIPIFRDLNDAQLQLLIPIISKQNCVAGELIFQQDELANFLYILKSGEVLVEYKPFDGPQLVVAHIKPGDVFGWSAALGHAVYTSSAHAVPASSVYRLDGSKLQQLCARHPETGVLILAKLSSVISNRLSNTQSLFLSHFSHQFADKNGGIVETR
jgi:CRP-like cAMP-binding protein